MLPRKQKVHEILQTQDRLLVSRRNIFHLDCPGSLKEVWSHRAGARVAGPDSTHLLLTQQAITVSIQVTELLPNLLYFLQHVYVCVTIVYICVSSLTVQ